MKWQRWIAAIAAFEANFEALKRLKQGYGEGYMRYANTAVKKVKKVVSAKSLQARIYDVSFDSYDVIRRRGVFYGA